MKSDNSSGVCPACGALCRLDLQADLFDELDEESDIEAWEGYVDLVERQEYPALVQYCEEEVRRNPGDFYAAVRLGDAYVRNGQYEKAIEFLTPYHRAEPDCLGVNHVILDSLFALGRTEDDFDWVARPTVYRLGSDVLDAAHRYLVGKRKPRPPYELMWKLCSGGYAAFSEKELMAALREDPRFEVEEGHSIFAEIRAAVRASRRRRRTASTHGGKSGAL